jgi:periplasmic divalent cation tolerance protein
VFTLVYVTHKDKESAKEMSDELLKLKLIACVNCLPIESSFWWQGEIESNKEYVTIFKTSSKNWLKLRAKIEELHPYDCPCIIKLNVEANEAYENWIEEESAN